MVSLDKESVRFIKKSLDGKAEAKGAEGEGKEPCLRGFRNEALVSLPSSQLQSVHLFSC